MQRALAGGEIPVIDVTDFLAGRPGAAAKAAAELRVAFETVGFYYLRGHGVPSSLIDATYAEAARFHAQPPEAKLAVKVDEHNIGYMPIARKPPPNAAGLDHFTVELASARELADVVQRLEGARVPATRHGDMVAVADPEGNRLRLLVEEG